jgi:hypothetical protein
MEHDHAADEQLLAAAVPPVWPTACCIHAHSTAMTHMPTIRWEHDVGTQCYMNAYKLQYLSVTIHALYQPDSACSDSSLALILLWPQISIHDLLALESLSCHIQACTAPQQQQAMEGEAAHNQPVCAVIWYSPLLP